MARLYGCGFELNTRTDNVEWGDSFVSTNSSIVTVGHRSGTYGYRVTAAGVAGRDRPHVDLEAADSDNAHYMRFYMKVVDLADGASVICKVQNNANATKGSLQLETDGTITLRNGSGTQIGSASSALSLNQWYCIEFKYFNNTGSGKAELEGRINGISFASTTTETVNGGIRKYFFGFETSTTNYDVYFDDWAINDSSGSSQNSYPGSGKIIHLRPNAAGDNSDFTNDYLAVDEVTPDDATTIAESTTLNAIDDHNIDATPSDMTTLDKVNCVMVGVRFRADGASEPSFVLRIKATASGTVEESAGITPVDTAFHTHGISTFAHTYNLVLYDLPGASTTAWTKTTLDTAQIGYRISADATNNIEISTVWLLVDYIPFLVQSKSNAGQASTSNAISFNEAVTSGNTVVVDVSTFDQTIGATAVADNQGNTYTRIDEVNATAGPENNLAMFYAKNVTASGTFTVTATPSGGGSTDISVAIHEYLGLHTGSPFVTKNSATGTGTAVDAGNVVTTTADNVIHVAEVDSNGNNAARTPGTGYTMREELNDSTTHERLGTMDKVIAAGTYAGDMTIGASSDWGAISAAFSPSSNAAGGAGIDWPFMNPRNKFRGPSLTG